MRGASREGLNQAGGELREREREDLWASTFIGSRNAAHRERHERILLVCMIVTMSLSGEGKNGNQC